MLHCGDSSRLSQDPSPSNGALIIVAAMPFVLALDQGTTSSRAIVFDESGAVRAMAQAEFRQIFPQPGWVEHDPEEIWRTQLARGARGARQRTDRGRATSRRSASPISARRRCCGTARPARRSPTPSSGRTAGPPTICDELEARRPRATGHAQRPASCSIRTSPAPSSLAARPRARRARAGRARRARLRHDRHLARSGS